MFNEFRQRVRDRREQYSLRRHFGRLERERRLPHLRAGTLAPIIGAGMTFGQSQSSNIPGPGENLTTSNAGGAANASLVSEPDAFTFQEKTVQRNVVFTGVNPCNGDAVRLEGSRYEKIRISAGVTYTPHDFARVGSCLTVFASD